MKDYERYMNRQKVSDTGMETLLKLETERPERPVREESRVPQWLKYVGMAACFCLMMGLFALPILQGAQQRRAISQPKEELFFHEMSSLPFTDQTITVDMGWNAMEKEEAAAIFGSAPDDFEGFLESMGLDKFDMEYYTVDMTAQGDDRYRFWMKGDYLSPEAMELLPTTSFTPANTVWLEVFEGHSYLDEAEWKELESCTFHGHQVTAAYDENHDRAIAAFNMESGGKNYGVLYSVTTDGERNAKELVTKMTGYLTTNGLFGSKRAVTGELHFNELDDVPLLSGRAAEKGDTVTSMDKEALYALFGKTARWPDMGWEKYFTVSGQRRDKADGTREYALWGSDNVAGFSSKFGTRSSGVWLELTENGAFFEEEWKGLTVSVINSCEVVAVIGRNEEKGMYRAAAVFQTVGESGPYGVFYAVETTSEVYAKRLVSQMADYLTANGIFTQEREILSVKFSGWYVMETDGKETWPSVPSVTFNEDGSFGVFVAYCSSHICQGDYEITDGRVTVRCPQHTYVFDILDEETLRFVGAESSEPEHYGDDDCPKITDGAVFRLQEILFGEEENVTATEVVGPYYLEVEDADEGSFRPVITFYQDGKFQCISDLASSHYCVGPYTVKNGRVTANCDQHRFVFDIDGDDLRYVGAESDKMARFIAPEVTDGAVFRRPDGAEQWGRTYEFSPFRYAISPRAALEPAELGGRYYMEAADGSALASSYLEIERNASQQDAARKMTVHFASRNCACDAAVYNTTRDRITYVCSECKSVYTFDIVDSETLRYVASGNKDCIDDCTVFRHLKDGERANTTALKPEVEITDLGSSLWEDRGSGATKEGVSYELTYQANEAAAGKKLEFYLELSEKSQELLGLDGPVCIQTYCRKAGEEYKSSKKVYGDFAFGSVSGQDMGDVTVRCVCDGEEIACQTMPWGNYTTFVWDVQQATHHPEPSHHMETYHSDSHH